MNNKNFVLLFFVIVPLRGESQDVVEEKRLSCLGDYKLRVEVPIYECTVTGIILTDTVFIVAEPGSLFTVVNITAGDSLVIRFWEWKENKALNFRLCFADSSYLKRKYFIVPNDIGDRVVKRFHRNSSFTAGTVLIPFKLRLQKFDFSKDLTLGPAAGIRFRLSHYSPDYVNVIFGMGITSVTIDENSTDGNATESSEAPALTPSIGFVFELNNTVQAGVFCGWDYVAHNDKLHFIYQGKTWLSFGLGYSLISANEEKLIVKR